MSGELWSLFVDDGVRLARGLRDACADGLPDGTEGPAADAYALATAALTLGVGDVGMLAEAVARALSSEGTAKELAARVGPAAQALDEAMTVLARPDASGARTDPAPLIAARAALEAAAPAVAVAAAGEAGDSVWVPAVPEDMLELFFEEANERLEGLASKLLDLERRSDDPELVREVFRDLHTLKGSSAMVGLAPLNRLAHAAEDLVGQLRDGRRAADRPTVDVLLVTLDALRAIVERAMARAAIDIDTRDLVARLRSPGAFAAPARVEPAGPAGHAAAAKQTLRVDFDKLDLLLNLVGELVLGKAALGLAIGGIGSLGRELEADRRLARRAAVTRIGERKNHPLHLLGEELSRVERVFHELSHDLETSSGRLDRVAAELRDQVMKLRMVPIGGVFRKHQRTVRDLAHRLGKEVRLELAGEDTELDKVLVEQLDDPLMHLLRNAVDHGLELPSERSAAGKPPEGRLRLSAHHQGNQIIIVLVDDGRGIDPVRLRKKALEKGVATAEELAGMDDHAALELIFRPGFSTAATVSDVSGRGVGMDVVRETIVNRLKGSVDVASEVGAGAAFTLRLPLTLAIIQVLLARAGGEILAIPLDVVRRTFAVAPRDLHPLHDRQVVTVDGRHVPVVRVAETLELPADGEDEAHIVLVDTQGGLFGLLFERLLGKQEVVIKSLGSLLGDVPCAAGATLLGDRPAIILDVPAIVARGTAPRGPGPPPRPAAGSPPPFADASARRRRVLLVEDSDTSREAMRRALEGAGYAVSVARDGAEALALLEREPLPFDLVSTDVMMPNVDGYELTRALRASPRHRHTPIIMVTGRGEKIDRVRGFDAGVDEYLTKPHDRKQLLDAVARHLEKRR